MNAPENIYTESDPEFTACPFCGGVDIKFDGIYAGEDVPGSDWVVCEGCGASAPNAETWNTRHDIHAAVVAERDELRRQRELLVASLAECHQYMKDEETPAQCIKRNRDDMTGLLSLLADERRTVEQLRARLDAAMEDKNGSE